MMEKFPRAFGDRINRTHGSLTVATIPALKTHVLLYIYNFFLFLFLFFASFASEY